MHSSIGHSPVKLRLANASEPLALQRLRSLNEKHPRGAKMKLLTPLRQLLALATGIHTKTHARYQEQYNSRGVQKKIPEFGSYVHMQ